jgi:ribosomal protein S18 acetylase RimI-like enzyme
MSSSEQLRELVDVPMLQIGVDAFARFLRANTDWNTSDADVALLLHTLPSIHYTLVRASAPQPTDPSEPSTPHTTGTIAASASATLLSPNAAFLTYVVTDTALRRRGLARRTVTHILSSLRSDYCITDARLLASADAVPLYESLGFVRTSHHITLYKQPPTLSKTALHNVARAHTHATCTAYAPPTPEQLNRALQICRDASPPDDGLRNVREALLREAVTRYDARCVVLGDDTCCFARRTNGGLFVGPLVAGSGHDAAMALFAVLAGEEQPASSLALRSGDCDDRGLAGRLAFEELGFVASGTVPLMRANLSATPAADSPLTAMSDAAPQYFALTGWECF